jgi:uncharacterized protein
MYPSASESLVREVCAALLAHDIATLQLLIAPHICCHVPGRNRYAGEFRGFGNVLTLWLNATQRRAATLELQIEEVLTGVCLTAAICRWTCKGQEASLTERGICLVRIVDGRISECWLYLQDQYQVDDSWS